MRCRATRWARCSTSFCAKWTAECASRCSAAATARSRRRATWRWPATTCACGDATARRSRAHNAAGGTDPGEGFSLGGTRRSSRSSPTISRRPIDGCRTDPLPAPATAQARRRAGTRAASQGRTGRVPAAGHVRLVSFSRRPRAMPAIGSMRPSPRPARCPGSPASTGRSKWRSRSGRSGCQPACCRGARRIARCRCIGRAFPGVIEDCGDALSGALMNAGPIIHPPLITMNAAPLEHFERWDIHKEGTQPATAPRHRRARRGTHRGARGARLRRAAFPPRQPLCSARARNGCTAAARTNRLTDLGDWREHIVLTQHRYMLEDRGAGPVVPGLGRRIRRRADAARARFPVDRERDLRRGLFANRKDARVAWPGRPGSCCARTIAPRRSRAMMRDREGRAALSLLLAADAVSLLCPLPLWESDYLSCQVASA